MKDEGLITRWMMSAVIGATLAVVTSIDRKREATGLSEIDVGR